MATNEEAARDDRDESRRLMRRRAMKAGAVLIPTVLTLRARPAFAQAASTGAKVTVVPGSA